MMVQGHVHSSFHPDAPLLHHVIFGVAHDGVSKLRDGKLEKLLPIPNDGVEVNVIGVDVEVFSFELGV